MLKYYDEYCWTDLTFNLFKDDLRSNGGTSPWDIDLIQKGCTLFGYNHEMYLCLLADYVPKLYPKRKIKTQLQLNPENTFLHMIHPSDIAFTILLIKNGKALWISQFKNKDNTKALFNSETFWRGYVEC